MPKVALFSQLLEAMQRVHIRDISKQGKDIGRCHSNSKMYNRVLSNKIFPLCSQEQILTPKLQKNATVAKPIRWKAITRSSKIDQKKIGMR